MKATSLRYLPDGAMEIFQADVGDPKEGEIQVAGEVCGICSWDIATCKNGAKFKVPAPPGHEGIGRITKVGRGVAGLAEGDLVTGGGFHTLQNFPASHAYKLPPSPLPLEYWLVEPASCAVTGLDHCRLRAGDRVALIGCGFMGLLLLQGLLRSFADLVVVIDVDPKKLELARTCGAREVHNSATENPDALAKDLKARGIDVVLDTSGTQSGLDLATKIVRSGGLINLFGWLKGETATFDPSAWHLQGISLVNSSPGARLRDVFPVAIRLIESGFFDLRPIVTHVVPLEDYPALMKKILAGDPGYVKGVVRTRA
jgi:threonine dehydrogenase-like Zn-dependent dehydrogenase